jgi:hypothetical protein
MNNSSLPNNDGWTQVRSKRHRNNLSRLKSAKHYWNGFDKNGEKWFIELSDGKILTSSDSEYQYWQTRYGMYK